MAEVDVISSFCTTVVSFAISIPMIAVGSSYWDWCKTGAAAYLYHAGILGMVVALVNILFVIGAYCFDCCRPNGKTKFLLTASIIIAEIVRMIWGFAIIFPKYEQWDYRNGNYSGPGYDRWIDLDSSPEYFCEKTPMVFAFVLLVIEAVLISLAACCGCCMGCIAILHGM